MRVILTIDEDKEHCVGDLNVLVNSMPEESGWVVEAEKSMRDRCINAVFMKDQDSYMRYSTTVPMMMHYSRSMDVDRPFDAPRETWFFYMANASIEGATPAECLLKLIESINTLDTVNEVLEPVKVAPVPSAIRKRLIIL